MKEQNVLLKIYCAKLWIMNKSRKQKKSKLKQEETESKNWKGYHGKLLVAAKVNDIKK